MSLQFFKPKNACLQYQFNFRLRLFGKQLDTAYGSERKHSTAFLSDVWPTRDKQQRQQEKKTMLFHFDFTWEPLKTANLPACSVKKFIKLSALRTANQLLEAFLIILKLVYSAAL